MYDEMTGIDGELRDSLRYVLAGDERDRILGIPDRLLGVILLAVGIVLAVTGSVLGTLD